MVDSNINKRKAVNQAIFTDSSKDGDRMLQRTFQATLDNIIREHAIYTQIRGCYSLFADDLPREDKLFLLSYLIPIEDYEHFNADKHLQDSLIDEYLKEMQFLIDECIDDIWHEDMREMGQVLCHHKDNNEPYYVKRS